LHDSNPAFTDPWVRLKMSTKEILISSTKMLIELSKLDEFEKELHPVFTPIPWFGNISSPKPKIVTIGANPSRSEFLKGGKAFIQKQIDQGQIPEALKPARLETLKGHETLDEILKDDELICRLMSGFNHYFKRGRRPYTQWFGNPSDGKPFGSRMEAFINGLSSSYYDNDDFHYQAIHIDMIPLATISDFTSITHKFDEVLFKSGWAKSIITSLIDLIKPELIVIPGKSNQEYFSKYFWPLKKRKIIWEEHSEKPIANFAFVNSIPAISTPVYVPNPRYTQGAYTSEELFEFARFLNSASNYT
jgi:hypothetical protein